MEDPLVTIKTFLPLPFSDGEGVPDLISSLCIWTILGVGLCAFVVQLLKFLRARGRLKRGIKILNEVEADQLAASRRQIDESMGAIPYLGELWHEFDETLVASRDDKRIYNTLDADHFFNTTTLGEGVTESRFIAAVPGMLTALGVFGTFVGLQLGLASLDLSNTETMTRSMTDLTAGAAIAFKTSVWGIIASLVFNVAEKLIEGSLINQIRTFQFKTDRLFDRTLGEQALLEIEGHVGESEKLLRVLGEQIGDKIQEGISSAIAPALEALANTMEDLANRQASGAESALRDLVEQFTSELGDAGRQQSEDMAKSAEALTGAIGELNITIADFLNKVGDQIDQLKEVTESGQEVTKETQRKAAEFVRNATESQQSYAEVSNRVSDAARSLGQAVQSLSEVEEGFDATIAKFGRTQERASETFDQSAEALTGASNSLSLLGGQISESSRVMTESMSGFADTAKEAAQSLEGIPESHRALLNGFFSDLNQKMDLFTSSVSEQMEEFAQKLQGSTDSRVDEWTKNTLRFCNNMTDAVGLLSQTITELDERFNNGLRQ